MTSLSVNVNKVALLRNSRDSGVPSVTWAAAVAIENGADGITVHPRPDKRHIRRSDVHALNKLIKVELNIEGNPFEPMFLELIRVVKPAQCTLVPDVRDQLTSDHGWDLAKQAGEVRPILEEFRSLGVRSSLFMDPEPELMAAAKAVGADRVELYTGPYAEGWKEGRREQVLKQYAAAAQAAVDVGLGVNAGHDLNRENLGPFLDAVPGILEVSIGHALIADALEFGLAATVQKYVEICRASR